MPWLDDSDPPTVALQQLRLTLKNAFLRRARAPSLSEPLQQLSTKYTLPPDGVSRVLFGFRSKTIGADDPLLFEYAEALLHLKLVNAGSLLRALFETSRFSKQAADYDVQDTASTGLPMCEDRIFTMLMQKYAAGTLSLDRAHLHGLVYAFARWMAAVTEYELSSQLLAGPVYTGNVFFFSAYEALASLALVVLSDRAFRSVAKQSWWKTRRPVLVNEMQNFDMHVLSPIHSQFTGRLQNLATCPPFLETDEEGKPVFTEAQILNSMQDLQVMHTHAGLYIWLNACLSFKPFTDDSSMIMYLQARYNGNMQPLVVDLLTASFDTLTNFLRRKESDQSVKVVKSFVCNKLPLLLSFVANSMLPAGSVDAFVQMAFATITMDPLPPITAGATEVREKLKVTRLEFLHACVLHGVIAESSVASIVQEQAASGKTHKYTKEGLMAKYGNNITSAEPLIDELESMNGNAGAIASFFVDIVNNLCVTADTMSLRLLCNMMIKKIPAMDILLQYTSVAHFLQPLCNQLNGWTHDQDQVEFTPGYEEFSSILLFILAVVHRYRLTPVDLGLQDESMFMSGLLREPSKSYQPSDLTPEQDAQLSKWIEALYTLDEQGESSGISDEVMRPCPPQAFYQLVPSLFEQSIMASKMASLRIKAFKGGMDLLTMPFLLPSLVPALSWLIRHAWENPKDVDILLQVFEKLIKPSNSSPETKAMHRAVLVIVADPLSRALLSLSQKSPGKKEISGLLDTLKPFLGQSRRPGSSKGELTKWTRTPNGGISAALRQVIRDQVAWLTNIGPTPPPEYSHGLYTTACQMLGIDAVLDIIIAELSEQSKAGNGPYAIDVCAALVCTPSGASPVVGGVFPTTSSHLTEGQSMAREILHLRSNNAQQLLKTSADLAESLVRLARRVDAQLVVTQMPQIDIALPLQAEAADQLMADLGLADENMAAVAAAQDVSAALDATSGADFANVNVSADLAAVLDQSMAGIGDAQNLAGAAMSSSDLAGLPAVPADGQTNIFDDLSMNMDLAGMAAGDTIAAQSGVDPNAEDDIFAELDMSNLDDFTFS